MPRIIKENTIRRNEILDAAQRLINAKGYERMTIQDIQEELQIAKGLFYYYFASKQAMLVSLSERMMEALVQSVKPIVDDPDLLALEKLQLFFDAIVRWETGQKTFMLTLLPIWYADDNVAVREKIRTMMVKYDAPLLTTIIHQGIQEGAWKTAYPDQVTDIALLLFQGLKDTLARLLLSLHPGPGDLQPIEVIVAGYTDSLERILGLPSDSLHLMDTDTFKVWLET